MQTCSFACCSAISLLNQFRCLSIRCYSLASLWCWERTCKFFSWLGRHATLHQNRAAPLSCEVQNVDQPCFEQTFDKAEVVWQLLSFTMMMLCASSSKQLPSSLKDFQGRSLPVLSFAAQCTGVGQDTIKMFCITYNARSPGNGIFGKVKIRSVNPKI